jgi:hypothetical protein
MHGSPQLMTPPRRGVGGAGGVGGELAKTMMAAAQHPPPPHISTDSGLVASLGFGDGDMPVRVRSLSVSNLLLFQLI